MTTSKNKPGRILFAASEIYPLVKTGGLADVACFLPQALRQLGYDIRLVLPAYRSVLEQAPTIATKTEFFIPESRIHCRLLETTLPDTDIPVYLMDAPAMFDRDGTPYQTPDHTDWPDNDERFALFGRAIRLISLGMPGLDWQPALLHCNDWHTGLAPALLSLDSRRPACVFGIHNLAYQGLFANDAFNRLGIAAELNSMQALEFHGQLSFIKGGLVFADHLITVSPRYANEITTAAHGHGLEGLLEYRRHELSGILNGVDYAVWDPRHDPLIAHNYWSNWRAGKKGNKRLLQKELGLTQNDNAVLLGYIGRLTEQKGSDLILDTLPELLGAKDVQLVMLGDGNPEYEKLLADAGSSHAGKMAVRFAYDEMLAHQIQASADILLMPSRFEPCGLTQLYALRYGTIPVVHATGGLADTIVDTNESTLHDGTATGFHFKNDSGVEYLAAAHRAIGMYHSAKTNWRQLVRTAMKQEFSWADSARQHSKIYQALIATP